MLRLKNKRILITGATGGIGKALVARFYREDAIIYPVARDRKRLENLINRFTNNYNAMEGFQADLNSDQDLEELCFGIKNKIKKLDIIIFSAADFIKKNIEDTTSEDFTRLFNVNVKAPLIITKSLLPLLKNTKGQIVFLNSTVALMNSRASLALYTASKYAMRAIADSLREEVNDSGVRVVTIYPGRTDTKLQKRIHSIEGRNYNKNFLMKPDDIVTTVVHSLTLSRSAEITDVYMRPHKKIH